MQGRRTPRQARGRCPVLRGRPVAPATGRGARQTGEGAHVHDVVQEGGEEVPALRPAQRLATRRSLGGRGGQGHAVAPERGATVRGAEGV